MRSPEFNNEAQFLRKMIAENPDNKELIEVYKQLLKDKSQYDLETEKANTRWNETVHTNNTEWNKTVHTNDTNFRMAMNKNNTAACYPEHPI